MTHEQAAAPAAAQAASDELDAARERLERALAEERQKSAALRASVDGLQFKLDVLEKSYAKQLADARKHAEAAARTLAEREADLAGLAERHEQTQHELERALAELERTGTAAAKTRAPVARPRAAASSFAAHMGTETHEGTINALLGAVPWEQEPRARRDDSQAAARVRQEAARVPQETDAPAEEMLAPDLVFTGAGEDDDER